MDSKGAPSHPIMSEASSGSSSSNSSSYSVSSDNETVSKKPIVLNDDSGRSGGKGTVSEDEGYESGNEEFETASDKLVLDEIVGEGIGEVGSDASGKVDSLPIFGGSVNDEDDDDDEKEDKDIEGGIGAEVSEGGEFSRVEGFDRNDENIYSVENLGVKSDGKEEIEGEESETKGESGNLSFGGEVSEPQVEGVVEQEESEFIGTGDVKITSERDSVVDVAGPEVAVVGESEEKGDLEFNDTGDVKITPEGDSVVDVIQVDVAGPGVAVVGATEEKGDAVNEPEEEVVTEVAVVEPEESEVVSLGDAKGDSVVDAIQVEAVVGETEENGADVNKLEHKEVAEAVGIDDDVRLASEEDSVVDTIQVDMVDPGVAVVGDMKGKEGEKIEGVEVPLVSVGGHTEHGDVADEKDENAADIVEPKPPQPEHYMAADEKDENTVAVVDVVNGVNTSITRNDSVDIDKEDLIKKTEVEYESAPISEAIENGITAKTSTDGEVGIVDVIVGSEREVNQLDISNAGTTQTNGDHTPVHAQNNGLADGVSDESKGNASAVPKSMLVPHEIREVEEDMDEEVHPEDSMSDGDSDGMIFGSSEAAKKFIEELERESGGDSHTGADSSLNQSQRVDGQIVTDSEEEGETDDEGDGKELFDNAALAALLKATGADSDGGTITITSQDGSRLFSVERPAGLGSSLQSLRPGLRPNRPSLFSTVTPAAAGEAEDSLSEEEKKKLEKLQHIRVKFLRLVHRLGLSPEESVVAQVLYRLALLGGRQGTQTFSLDAAKRTALQLEAGERDDLDFSVNILVLGKSGVGKSATINSLFGEEKAPIHAFEMGTASAKEISGLVDGVKVRVVDTPGLKSSVMEQGYNRSILSSVKKFTKKSPPDVVLYVDRLDAQSRDLNDLPLLKTVTSSLGSSIWRSAIVTLSHAASAPPDGPTGTSLSYEVFVSQRSHVVQQSIGHAVGDLRMMSPSLMNPVSLVENHLSCRKNREGQKILPNGQSWRPQLLLLCYSMKILSEASSLSKPQDPFDHRKLFGFRARSPPLPYMLSSMLQSRTHPKLQSDQGGENADSDIDLDDLSDSDQEEVDEYDQLPPFKPLKKAQLAKLGSEQRKAYFEEYDYRVKLLQKKQWKEELRRMREIKKKGKDGAIDYGLAEDDADGEAVAPVAVPLPDMALPPSFDGDNPAYRYRFLEPTSQFLARPVLDNHGWDHDCGYDGVNFEHSLAIASRFPAVYTIQISKDKKDFSISLDSSISAKHGENMSSMAGFDIQSMGKQLAYIVRGETKLKKFKKNKATGGVSFTFLGENIVPGVKIEDQITLGKQYSLVGSVGAVRSQQDTAYGANFELQRRELDYPIGQVQSTFSMSLVKWRGDLALGLNSLAQFSIGRNSKVAVRAGINNKLSGQITVRTSSSDHLSLALAAIIPTALSIYKKFSTGTGEKYSIF